MDRVGEFGFKMPSNVISSWVAACWCF